MLHQLLQFSFQPDDAHLHVLSSLGRRKPFRMPGDFMEYGCHRLLEFLIRQRPGTASARFALPLDDFFSMADSQHFGAALCAANLSPNFFDFRVDFSFCSGTAFFLYLLKNLRCDHRRAVFFSEIHCMIENPANHVFVPVRVSLMIRNAPVLRLLRQSGGGFPSQIPGEQHFHDFCFFRHDPDFAFLHRIAKRIPPVGTHVRSPLCSVNTSLFFIVNRISDADSLTETTCNENHIW